MAKKMVTRQQLCELLLKEVHLVSGLEGVTAVNVHLLAEGERENGANWSLANFNPGPAGMDSVEVALTEIGPRMQREYAVEEE